MPPPRRRQRHRRRGQHPCRRLRPQQWQTFTLPPWQHQICKRAAARADRRSLLHLQGWRRRLQRRHCRVYLRSGLVQVQTRRAPRLPRPCGPVVRLCALLPVATAGFDHPPPLRIVPARSFLFERWVRSQVSVSSFLCTLTLSRVAAALHVRTHWRAAQDDSRGRAGIRASGAARSACSLKTLMTWRKSSPHATPTTRQRAAAAAAARAPRLNTM